MHEGIELLLARMNSHPEEFEEVIGNPYELTSNGVNKWQSLISQIINSRISDDEPKRYLPFLSNEEVKTVYDKWVEIQSVAFHKQVMKTILDEPIKTEDITWGAVGAVGTLLVSSTTYDSSREQEEEVNNG